MGIVRGSFRFEEQYTQIPNEWVRDKSLSLKARGLLAELMSHRAGWETSIAGLASDKEGESAVRSGVKELEEAGFLRREKKWRDGRIYYDWLLGSANTQVEIGCENLHAMELHATDRTPKKTIPLEDNLKEPSLASDGFEEWWSVYPRKIAKPNALRAYQVALKKTTSDVLLSTVGKLAGEWSGRSREELKFCPHPATWLNGERWNDYVLSTEALDAAIGEGSLEKIRSLTSVPVPSFDAGDVSPAEAVAARKRFVAGWARENYRSLVEGLK